MSCVGGKYVWCGKAGQILPGTIRCLTLRLIRPVQALLRPVTPVPRVHALPAPAPELPRPRPLATPTLDLITEVGTLNVSVTPVDGGDTQARPAPPLITLARVRRTRELVRTIRTLKLSVTPGTGTDGETEVVVTPVFRLSAAVLATSARLVRSISAILFAIAPVLLLDTFPTRTSEHVTRTRGN